MASIEIETLGWIGTVLILVAYFLLTSRGLTGGSKLYHILNLLGGIGIVVNSISNGAYPPAGLNVVWSIIAGYGIIRLLRSPRANTS